ncbi:MAG TPA: hypothetical protein VKE93_21210 [Candidatus Angelobacter sp.]|nr:hypothetical protein [Candidatus Angelobacter sp.]
MLANRFLCLSVLFYCCCATVTLAAQALPSLNDIDQVASTVPANGDVNPYGVALIPASKGKLVEGNILISNFNNGKNQQGTGSTIVQISPSGAFQLFAQIDVDDLPGKCPGGIGLTTALVVLRSGWVVVGSLPTSDGTSATINVGCLIVLNANGNVVETISGGNIAGPWDMTAADGDTTASLFVTNILNNTNLNNNTPSNSATVVRVVLQVDRPDRPQVVSSTVIGSGFPVRFDPAALIIGPTGVALDGDQDLLFVSDSLNNRIAGIPNPLTRTSSVGTGVTISEGGALNDPLGMTLAPNGNIIVANGADGNLVEITHDGQQVAKRLVDSSGSPPGAGALFGLLAIGNQVFFVDDATNFLDVAEPDND